MISLIEAVPSWFNVPGIDERKSNRYNKEQGDLGTLVNKLSEKSKMHKYGALLNKRPDLKSLHQRRAKAFQHGSNTLKKRINKGK